MSSEVSFDVCMGEGSQILIRLGGRACQARCRLMCVWVRASSDVCLGEGSQILIGNLQPPIYKLCSWPFGRGTTPARGLTNYGY